VQGLTPGLGWRVRPGNRGWLIAASAAYGTADRRFTGRLTISRPLGAWTVEVGGTRAIRDIGDEPVISPVLNSIVAQERGVDYGDYVLLHRAALGGARGMGTRGYARVELAAERVISVSAAARAASGQYRPNPSLGGPARAVARLVLEHTGASLGGVVNAGGRLAVEAGSGRESAYGRARVEARITATAGATEVVFAGQGGWASVQVPADRAFVLGGRGTLPGDPYRAWGGRQVALGRVEWRVPIPFVALPLGGFGSTGRRAFLAPFVAVGWTGAPLPGGVGLGTAGARVSGGAALELFHRLLRVEFASSFHAWRAAWSVDIRRDLWPIL
jgi:hypothetical protein